MGQGGPSACLSEEEPRPGRTQLTQGQTVSVQTRPLPSRACCLLVQNSFRYRSEDTQSRILSPRHWNPRTSHFSLPCLRRGRQGWTEDMKTSRDRDSHRLQRHLPSTAGTLLRPRKQLRLLLYNPHPTLLGYCNPQRKQPFHCIRAPPWPLNPPLGTGPQSPLPLAPCAPAHEWGRRTHPLQKPESPPFLQPEPQFLKSPGSPQSLAWSAPESQGWGGPSSGSCCALG